MKVAQLNPISLTDLKEKLNEIDPDVESLYFEGFDIGLNGYYFEHNGHRFDVVDVMLDCNEIPLLTVLRADALEAALLSKDMSDYEYDEESGCCVGEESELPGVYTRDERPYGDFYTNYKNHTGWEFSADGRYAWNIPNIENGTLVGFYWVNLLSVLDSLRRD